jgi:hypothetical protein
MRLNPFSKVFVVKEDEFPELPIDSSVSKVKNTTKHVGKNYVDKLVSEKKDADGNSNNKRGWVYMTKERLYYEVQRTPAITIQTPLHVAANKAVKEIAGNWRKFVDMYAEIGRLDEYVYYYGESFFKDEQNDDIEDDYQNQEGDYTTYQDWDEY